MNTKKHRNELTRDYVVSDIYPQCFSRGNDYRESLGPNDTNDTARKSTCKACTGRITSARYITDQNYTFCSTCIDSEGLHHDIWPDCDQRWHLPLDHLASIENERK